MSFNNIDNNFRSCRKIKFTFSIATCWSDNECVILVVFRERLKRWGFHYYPNFLCSLIMPLNLIFLMKLTNSATLSKSDDTWTVSRTKCCTQYSLQRSSKLFILLKLVDPKLSYELFIEWMNEEVKVNFVLMQIFYGNCRELSTS